MQVIIQIHDLCIYFQTPSPLFSEMNAVKFVLPKAKSFEIQNHTLLNGTPLPLFLRVCSIRVQSAGLFLLDKWSAFVLLNWR